MPLGSGDPLHVTLTLPGSAGTAFTAPEGPATLYFQVVATDSLGAPTTGNVTVNVLANHLPVITNGASQTINNVKTNVSVQLNGGATDPDNAPPSANHVLTYAWSQVDGSGVPLAVDDPDRVILSNAAISNPTFTSPASPTTLHFKVVVSDGYGTTEGTVTVTVVGSGTPVASAGPDQTPGRGRVVTLDGSGSSDPDTDPITYAWVQVDGAGVPLDSGDPFHVTLSSATAQKPTFTAPIIIGTPVALHFALRVTDVPYGLVSGADTVDITLLENQAPVADAGAAQTNKATNSVVTLSGAASSDIDISDPLTYAWVQVDPLTDLPLDPGPTKVTLSNPAIVNPTFASPHFATSTTLKFRLVVTDAHATSSAPAFTTVQINANRAPAVGTPSATPSSRPVGTTVTVTVPASAADADGDPVAGFTYQWVQTADAAATTACSPSCPIANVTLTPVGGTPRSATFVAPAFTVAGASLFFRLTVNDGFGATVQSNNLTVALTNSVPTVRFAVRPKQMTATATTTNATTSNQVYSGQEIQLDATQNPDLSLSTVDADGGTTFTYLWTNVTTSTGSTACSTNCIFGGSTATSTLAKPVFNLPSVGGPQFFMRLVVTDSLGGASTATTFSINRLANTAPTVGATGPSFAVQGSTGVTLTGTATDPQTSASPAQSLSFVWTQVDAAGVLLPVDDPLHVTLGGATTLSPTFDAPSTPGTVHFKLTVTDGAATVSATHNMEISLASNGAPTADAGPDQSAIRGGGHGHARRFALLGPREPHDHLRVDAGRRSR